MVVECLTALAGVRDAPVKRLSLLGACYGSAAKYCDDRVCLSVRLQVHLCNYTSDLHRPQLQSVLHFSRVSHLLASPAGVGC